MTEKQQAGLHTDRQWMTDAHQAGPVCTRRDYFLLKESVGKRGRTHPQPHLGIPSQTGAQYLGQLGVPVGHM